MEPMPPTHRHTVVHPRSTSLVLGFLALTTLLAACGSDAAVDDGSPSSVSYDGPLHLAEGEGRHPRAGAAGDVVDCNVWGTGGAFGGDVYSEGATSDAPAEAVETAYGEGLALSVPRDLAVAAESDDRVLYVAEAAGLPKAAVIVHEGEGTAGAGGDGWYVESWAVCDVVELPAAFVEERGYEVWTDAEGRVVPTRRLAVFRGAEHCGWQRMTFLSLGSPREGGPTFVRNPDRALRDDVAEPYQAHQPLPADAVDTGYRRGGDRLWLAPNRSRAYVGATTDDVEMWPRTVERLSCA
jgi:hypothetical protein